LGDVTVKAIATPGHTAGSMSWAWRSCKGGKCADIVFGASLNPVGPESYRFSDPAHRPVIAQLRTSFRTMRALPCDILITSHPEQSGGDTKFKGLKSGVTPNPFIDPGACRASVTKFETALADRLAKEQSAAKR
jgi:metallo-beta-lactamase class B